MAPLLSAEEFTNVPVWLDAGNVDVEFDNVEFPSVPERDTLLFIKEVPESSVRVGTGVTGEVAGN